MAILSYLFCQTVMISLQVCVWHTELTKTSLKHLKDVVYSNCFFSICTRRHLVCMTKNADMFLWLFYMEPLCSPEGYQMNELPKFVLLFQGLLSEGGGAIKINSFLPLLISIHTWLLGLWAGKNFRRLLCRVSFLINHIYFETEREPPAALMCSHCHYGLFSLPQGGIGKFLL